MGKGGRRRRAEVRERGSHRATTDRNPTRHGTSDGVECGEGQRTHGRVVCAGTDARRSDTCEGLGRRKGEGRGMGALKFDLSTLSHMRPQSAMHLQHSQQIVPVTSKRQCATSRTPAPDSLRDHHSTHTRTHTRTHTLLAVLSPLDNNKGSYPTLRSSPASPNTLLAPTNTTTHLNLSVRTVAAPPSPPQLTQSCVHHPRSPPPAVHT